MVHQETLTCFQQQLAQFVEAVALLDTSTSGHGGIVSVEYDLVKRAVAHGLRLVDPGQPFGTELFDALCRVTVTVAIEAVCLRLNEDQAIEVLLIQRRPDDSAYPGEWHCPGSAMRPGESHEDVFTRLSRGEFWAEIRKKEFLDNFNIPHEARGHFVSHVYRCEVVPGGKGTWFPITALPEKTVDHHRQCIIPRAVSTFAVK